MVFVSVEMAHTCPKITIKTINYKKCLINTLFCTLCVSVICMIPQLVVSMLNFNEWISFRFHTLISLFTVLFSLDISFQNVCGATTPSVVVLIKCQKECNCNQGTVANICCEHQFPYSLISPFLSLSLCLSFCPLHLCTQHALAWATAQVVAIAV